MDEAVIRYYRRLLQDDFPHAGEIVGATLFVEAIGEQLIHCGNTGNYMQLFLRLDGDRIAEIRYLCACEPAANVAVEVLCGLAQGRTLDEAWTLGEEAFYRLVGSRDEAFAGKVRGLLALLNEGIERYWGSGDGEGQGRRSGEAPVGGLSWDRSDNP